jgi:membrane protein
MLIKKYFVDFALLMKETMSEFIADNAIKLSASLSYYTIFSLPPLLIIIIALCGFFFGTDAVNGEVYLHIRGLIGNASALQIQDALKNIKLSSNNQLITSIGVIILFISASGVFAEIQDSINFIWRIKAKPNHGIIKFVNNRITSFLMIGSVGSILLMSLIVNSLVDLLNKELIKYFPIETIYIFTILNFIIIFIIITLFFTLLFRVLPDGKIVLKVCIIGASFTAVLFMIGKFLIGAYLRNSAIANIYGAAGSVIVILAWVYYSAIILYFGAEFTKVYALSIGQKILLNEYATQL